MLSLLTDDSRDSGGAGSFRTPALERLRWLLEETDLVKFAKVSPTANEARGALESAIRIVTTTRPAPVVPVVAAAGGVTEERHA